MLHTDFFFALKLLAARTCAQHVLTARTHVHSIPLCRVLAAGGVVRNDSDLSAPRGHMVVAEGSRLLALPQHAALRRTAKRAPLLPARGGARGGGHVEACEREAVEVDQHLARVRVGMAARSDAKARPDAKWSGLSQRGGWPRRAWPCEAGMASWAGPWAVRRLVPQCVGQSYGVRRRRAPALRRGWARPAPPGRARPR